VQTVTFDGQPDGVALETLRLGVTEGHAKLDALIAEL
jgi:hypothetical protein